MTELELELAYFRAMQDWMREEHNTRMMVIERNSSGFSEQVKKEELALQKYREAQKAWINRNRPKD